MNKKIITFRGTDIEKFKCHHRKNLVLLEDVDTQKTQVSNMVSSIEKNHKYFLFVTKMMLIKLSHYA